jgi:hypothetical protein
MMKTFNEKEVYQIFNNLFRFDEYKNGYVTTEMAINHLRRNGIVEPAEEAVEDFKEFTLIDIELPKINKEEN